MARHVWPRVKPRQEIFPGFLEIDFGDWETLTVGEVEERFPEAYARWKSTRDRFRYPGGESVPEFRERIARTARELFAVPGKGVTLAVLHKGVIKGVLAALLDQSFDSLRDYSVELGSIHRLSARKGSWLLESPGEVDHLGDDRSPEAILPEEKEDP
jgi:broad specificity phosphatase PhoE